jgi:hypothetical protein
MAGERFQNESRGWVEALGSSLNIQQLKENRLTNKVYADTKGPSYDYTKAARKGVEP